MDRFGGDDVVVVEHQHERVVARLQLVEKRGADEIRGRARPGTEQARGRLARFGPDRAQRRDEVPGETGEIVVGGIEREPGAGDAPRLEPAGERRRLAVAGRRREQREAGAVIEPRIEQRAQPRTLSVARDGGGNAELGRDERGSDLRPAGRPGGSRAAGAPDAGRRGRVEPFELIFSLAHAVRRRVGAALAIVRGRIDARGAFRTLQRPANRAERPSTIRLAALETLATSCRAKEATS